MTFLRSGSLVLLLGIFVFGSSINFAAEAEPDEGSSIALRCILMGACQPGSTPPPPPPPNSPFGLTERASLATFALPVDGVPIGSYSIQRRYPNITISGATYAAGVPGEDRIIVLEQAGIIRAHADDPSATTSRIVLNLSSRIQVDAEEGLLGFAFDPDFLQNRYVYMHYSMLNPRRSVISRMTWNANTDLIEPATEKIILELNQPYLNHNGGMIAFGPDDYLYIGFGDGGSGGDPENRAQDLGSLHGSILRINVHPANDNIAYEIPLDNPFVGQAGARGEIFAYGLRNPFRFSFDPQTGNLWAGDVGQVMREEIDIIESGGNYGWRVFEGTLPYDDSENTLPVSAFTPPVYEYGRSVGTSIIGGVVYRGNAIPSLVGRYLYADWGTGDRVWALTWDGQSVISNDVVAQRMNITGFGLNNDGEVLIAAQGGGVWEIVDQTTGGGELPTLLSETGLFTNLSNLTPANGLIPYAPGQPFWSDGTRKTRWIGVPDGQRITFTNNEWQFPIGTVSVKHFEIYLTENNPSSARRLETRVLIHTTQGWLGFTYKWNQAGTDATLLTGGDSEILTINLAGGGTSTQQYDYPSSAQCLSCHEAAVGGLLGPRTPQLNSSFDYGAVTDNQLRSWNNISLFNTDIGDTAQYDAFPALTNSAAALEDRARAYLDINCSQCHRPGGSAPTNIDLRYSTAQNQMNAVDVVPTAGSLGLSNARIIAPGDKSRSVLYERMLRLDGQRMPPLGSHVVDETGVNVVGAWIDSL